MVCQDMGLNLLFCYCCWHQDTIVNYSTFRLVFMTRNQQLWKNKLHTVCICMGTWIKRITGLLCQRSFHLLNSIYSTNGKLMLKLVFNALYTFIPSRLSPNRYAVFNVIHTSGFTCHFSPYLHQVFAVSFLHVTSKVLYYTKLWKI